ncbi:unnamed protein product [Lymnaea stagnalis]|uniref:Membrane insertase YidC/Oxa/ALB C-terminal domain-containing protein n=1 Tax=Lymnaea stagnalis TaxID=6523 RepID=A0AAV2H1E7_LYMST
MEFVFIKPLHCTRLLKNRTLLCRQCSGFEIKQKEFQYSQRLSKQLTIMLNKRERSLNFKVNNLSFAKTLPIINRRQKAFPVQTKMVGNQNHTNFLWSSMQKACSIRSSHNILVKSFSTSTARSSLSDTDIAMSTSTTVLPDSVSALIGSSPVNQLLFEEFPTICGAEIFLQYIHELTGLPWWSNILLTAFLMRAVLMLPLTIHVNHNQDKLRCLAPEIKEKAQIIKNEVKKSMTQFGWDKKRAMKEYDIHVKKLLRGLYTRDNCHPMKNTAIFWLQTPLFLSISYGLRNIVTRAQNPDMENDAEFIGLANEGFAWFADLTSVDATWILPVTVGLVTLFNIEMAHLGVPTVTTYRKWLTIALRSSCLLFIVISASVPSAMALYWASSGTLAVMQNLLFEFSPFRRTFKLPKSTTESNNPLRSLAQRAKAKYFDKQ